MFKKLRCKPFGWFLENVFPEKFIPTKNVKQYGQLKSHDDMCCDNLQLQTDAVGPLGMYPCHAYTYPSQLFSLSMNDELRQEEHCAEVTRTNTLRLVKCHEHKGNQEFVYENGLIRNPKTNMCLSSEDIRGNKAVFLASCDKESKFLKWDFVRKFNNLQL